MNNFDEHLIQFMREQIALEEHLGRIIEEQIAEIHETDFSDAKNLLINIRDNLERHFEPLNELLDKLEQEALEAKSKATLVGKASLNGLAPGTAQRKTWRVSRMLRDDYSALSLIAINNTLLHTTALALGCQEVAEIALRHLHNLAPLVIKMADLLPEIITRELRNESPDVDLTIAQTALKNTKLAWRRVY